MKGRRGSTLIEFALTGLPLIFLSISIFECSIAMLEYVSMANAATTAARYAANHGATCSQTPNSCTITVGNIAALIATFSWINDATLLTVSFTDNSGTSSCTLSVCETRTTTQFPAATSGANAVGSPITIHLSYPVINPLPVFSSPNTGTAPNTYTLGANSTQVIQF
ncbi:MAG TPA: TadE/TadG family type IV pilus assembly protein [Bryobacteraceae bacterium]|jgi:Flp pilus assembly protein TadG|nr:TadE/TadG family type IV pilus assembly protein [Bryobacteraceae bacterium]